MHQASRLRGLSTKLLPILVLAMTLGGCVRSCGKSERAEMTPEKVVQNYINLAMSMTNVGQREQLAEFTRGRLNEAIMSASEETIKKAYIERHYDLESYEVIERRDRTQRETEITFRIKYKDLGVAAVRPTDLSTAPIILTENTVALIKEKGIWYIRNVLGAKSKITFPMSEDSVIRATPGVMTPVTPIEPSEPAEVTPSEGVPN